MDPLLHACTSKLIYISGMKVTKEASDIIRMDDGGEVTTNNAVWICLSSSRVSGVVEQ
jgi:hypothetical protein